MARARGKVSSRISVISLWVARSNPLVQVRITWLRQSVMAATCLAMDPIPLEGTTNTRTSAPVTASFKSAVTWMEGESRKSGR